VAGLGVAMMACVLAARVLAVVAIAVAQIIDAL